MGSMVDKCVAEAPSDVKAWQQKMAAMNRTTPACPNAENFAIVKCLRRSLILSCPNWMETKNCGILMKYAQSCPLYPFREDQVCCNVQWHLVKAVTECWHGVVFRSRKEKRKRLEARKSRKSKLFVNIEWRTIKTLILYFNYDVAQQKWFIQDTNRDTCNVQVWFGSFRSQVRS